MTSRYASSMAPSTRRSGTVRFPNLVQQGLINGGFKDPPRARPGNHDGDCVVPRAMPVVGMEGQVGQSGR